MEANLENYVYSTKRVWIRWIAKPNVIQPFGYFYSVIDAIEFIKKIGYKVQDFIFESSDITVYGSKLN